MYHRIEKIDCPSLEKLNQLARLTIAFGLERQCREPEDIIRAAFAQHLSDQGFPLAGGWLWNKDKAIREPLVRLLAMPVDEKDAVLPAYDQDVDLEGCFKQDGFALLALPERYHPALELVNTIIGNFYTYILLDGVPGDKIGEKEPLTRQTVLRAFLRAQEQIRLLVCPGCDGPAPEVEADGKIHEDIDHFFPKSRYPFLSIHPLNLTPLCKHRNQDFKKDRDPLYSEDGVLAPFAHIYHPYACCARDELDVVAERCPEDRKPHIRLRAKNAEPQYAARLKGLNYLLSLESRWDGALHGVRDGSDAPEVKMTQVNKILKKELRSAVRWAHEYGVPMNEAWFQLALVVITKTIATCVGEHERHVPALAYARWVGADAEEQAFWLHMVRTAEIGAPISSD